MLTIEASLYSLEQLILSKVITFLSHKLPVIIFMIVDHFFNEMYQILRTTLIFIRTTLYFNKSVDF